MLAALRCYGFLSCRLVNDQLSDHRIVIGRNDVASWTCESRRTPKRPGIRSREITPGVVEVFLRVLGIYAAFDRRALLANVFLGEGQFLSRRHADLRLIRSMPVTNLRHRVFDLDAGIHFDEVVVARGIDNKLDRTGIGVVGRRTSLTAARHVFTGLWIKPRGGTLFDQFLMPALHRAVAFPKVRHVAGGCRLITCTST